MVESVLFAGAIVDNLEELLNWLNRLNLLNNNFSIGFTTFVIREEYKRG